MLEDVALRQVIVNLLALAESVPDLPPQTLERLQEQGEDVQSTFEGLVIASAKVQMALMNEPIYMKARSAWDSLVPENTRLYLAPTEMDQPSLVEGVQPLLLDHAQETGSHVLSAKSPSHPQWPVEQWVSVLQDAFGNVHEFAKKNELLKELARQINQTWPRHGDVS